MSSLLPSPRIGRPAPNRINLSGLTFGHLTIVRSAASRHHESGMIAYWLVRCVCGNEVEETTERLRRGYAKCCGCKRTGPPMTRPAKPGYVPPARSVAPPKLISEAEYQASVTAFRKSGFSRADAEEMALLGVIVEGRAA